MSCPTKAILGENITFTIQAKDATGEPVATDAVPTYVIYEDETATGILSGAMTQLAAQTGFYSKQIACTSLNGFERYKTYTIRISSAVAAVSVAKTYSFLLVGVEDTITATSGALTSTTNFKLFANINHTDDDILIAALITRATSAIQKYCDRILISDTYREILSGDGTDTLFLKEYPITNIVSVGIGLQDILNVTNTSIDAYNAYASVDFSDENSDDLTLGVQGGTNNGSNSYTLTPATTYTATSLVAAINTLGSGWAATLLASSAFQYLDATELIPNMGIAALNVLACIKGPAEFASGVQIKEFDNGNIYRGANFPKGNKNIVARYTGGYIITPADLEQICIDLVKVYYDGRKSTANVKAERLGDHAITYADDATNIPDVIALRLAPYKRYRF